MVTTDVIQAPVDAIAPALDAIVVAPDAVVLSTDAPVATDTSDVQESIPIPKDDAAAIAQAGEAISALTLGQYMGGALLVLGIIVFIFRKYLGKKPVGK